MKIIENKLYVLFTCLLCVQYSQAQVDTAFIASKVSKVDSSGWIFFYPDSLLEGQATTFINDAIFNDQDADIFHNETSFEEQWSRTDSLLTQTHTFYQQFHYTYPVLGGGYTEHSYETNYVYALSGRVVVDLPDLLDIGIVPEADALDSIINRSTFSNDTLIWNDSTWEAEYKEYMNDSNATLLPEGKLVWYQSDLDTTEVNWSLDGSNYTLCWEFKVKTTNLHISHVYYLDAQNGDFIDSVPLYMNSGTAICRFPYNSTQNIDTKWRGFPNYDYHLTADNSGRNFETRKYKIRRSWGLSGKVDDKDNVWGTSHQYATTAHFHVQNAWEYFRLVHAWNGPDNNGKKIFVWVAETESDFDDLKIEENNKGSSYLIMIGKKNGTDFRGTADEIGHEYAHAFMFETTGLSRSGISGAIHEGLADAFGVCVEHSIDGGNPDWEIGNDENIQSRNVSVPWLSNNANDYSDIQSSQTQTYNGGVAGRWFYILSQGESGGGSPGVSGIGIQSARKILFQMFSAGYVTSSAGYTQTASASVTAANQIFGECSWEARQTVLAWNRVGLFPQGSCTTSYIGNGPKASFSFKIYPNPAASEIKLEVYGLKDTYSIELVDIIGRRHIVERDLMKTSTNINISALPSGTYFCKIVNQNGVFVTKKLIITH